jgi:hypothetical protein
MRLSTAASFVLLCACAQPAFAESLQASITDISGRVFVQSVAGSKKAKRGRKCGMSLAVGDRLITGPQSTGSIVVAGCSVEIAPSSKFVVSQEAPCEAGTTYYAGELAIRPTNGTPIAGGGSYPGLTLTMGALGTLTVVSLMVYSVTTEETDPASAD